MRLQCDGNFQVGNRFFPFRSTREKPRAIKVGRRELRVKRQRPIQLLLAFIQFPIFVERYTQHHVEGRNIAFQHQGAAKSLL